MKVDQTEQDAVVPDVSELVDCSSRRNVTQLKLGLAVALVGAIIGFFIFPAPRLYGALIGFVVGGAFGVFVVGAVLAFTPKTPTLRSVVKIAARYRSARRQLLISLGLIPVLATLFPILSFLDSAAAWMIWFVVIFGLYSYSRHVLDRLINWQCPQCRRNYGCPGVIGELLRSGKCSCDHCDFSMFHPQVKPPIINEQ